MAAPRAVIHPRDLRVEIIGYRITMNEETHKYSVFNTTTNAFETCPITSVTHVLHHQFDAFDPNTGIEIMNPQRRLERYPDMNDEAIKDYWVCYGAYRSNVGKKWHNVLELLMNTLKDTDNWGVVTLDYVAASIPPPMPLEVKPGWWSGLGDSGVVGLRAHIARVMVHLQAEGLVPIAAEYPLYDKRGRVAGTMDAALVKRSDLANWNTATRLKVYVYDWKTRSKFTYDHSPRVYGYGKPDSPAKGQKNSHYTQALYQLNYYGDDLEERVVVNGRRIEVVCLRIISAHPELEDIIVSEIERDRTATPKLRAFRIAHPELDDPPKPGEGNGDAENEDDNK